MSTIPGKYAIVTGGSRGIGRAIAIDLAKRGAAGITITYASNTEAANDLLAELAKYNCKSLAVQVAQTPDNAWANSIIKQTMTAFDIDSIDILINNAGDMSLYEIGEVTPDAFYKTFGTNVLAPYLLAQAIIPVINPGGSIINISSKGARSNVGGRTTLYQSSKAALEHLTRQLAVTHAKEKLITINNVVPGGTDTDIFNHIPDHMRERLLDEATAERRLGKPEEVADVVCFLVGSPGGRWINGDSIAVCGGSLMW